MPLLGLTNVYAAEGRYEEAIGLYKRALAIQRAKGARDPDVAGFGISVPPPQFIGTYKGLVIERVLPRPEMNRECTEFASGCARRAEPDPTTFCVIVIPAIDGLVTPQVQERIRLHEIGHCAGWPADHPGARPGESPHQNSSKFVSVHARVARAAVTNDALRRRAL